jgi:hypothetical protein
VWLAVALALLPGLGVAALGFGWLAATLVDVGVLVPAALGSPRVWILRAAPVVGIAAAAAVLGWLAGRSLDSLPAGAAASVAVSLAAYGVTVRLCYPATVRRGASLARRAVSRGA